MPPDLQYINLSDFTPGIQQRVNRTGATVSPHSKASAATLNTFRCIALPDGGLGPLPKQHATYTPPVPVAPGNSALGYLAVVGFHVAGNVYTSLGGSALTASEFHLGYEIVDTTVTKRKFVWDRHRMWENVPTVTQLKSIVSTEPTPANNFRPLRFADHRADPLLATNPGVPVVAAAWYTSTGAYEHFWSTYPNPGSPASDTPLDISTSLALDFMFSHQARLMGFEQKGWSHGTVGNWAGNEQVWYTKANLTALDVTVAAVLGQETYGGYEFGISTDANEMLVVKVHGGAYVVRGDIASPTVIHLPGIVSGGGNSVSPAFSPKGLLYVAGYEGAYAWGGGPQAQPISRQLENNFWDISTAVDSPAGNAKDVISRMLVAKGDCAQWGDWVLVPNNWIWDSDTNAWWRLDDPASYQIAWWQTDWGGKAWGAKPFSDGVNPVVYGFDKKQPALSYRWQSQPLPTTMDKDVVCRQVVLVAQGTGTVVVTLTGLGGASTTSTFTLTGTIPLKLRSDVSLHASHVQVQIDSSGASAAPIVYEVNVGWHEASLVPSQSS